MYPINSILGVEAHLKLGGTCNTIICQFCTNVRIKAYTHSKQITFRARTALDNRDVYSVLMFVLNPAWPHFVGGFSIILACILGVTRFLLGGTNFPFGERIHPVKTIFFRLVGPFTLQCFVKSRELVGLRS
jgi:hypothetical protein